MCSVISLGPMGFCLLYRQFSSATQVFFFCIPRIFLIIKQFLFLHRSRSRTRRTIPPFPLQKHTGQVDFLLLDLCLESTLSLFLCSSERFVLAKQMRWICIKNMRETDLVFKNTQMAYYSIPPSRTIIMPSPILYAHSTYAMNMPMHTAILPPMTQWLSSSSFVG